MSVVFFIILGFHFFVHLIFAQVCTHLFPVYDTRMLALCVLVLVWLCALLTLATEWGRESVFGVGMPGGYQFLNCLFTSVVTRTAGFNSVNIAGLSSAGLVQILLHMYLSHYPFVVIMQGSNEDLDWKRYGHKEKKRKFQIRRIMVWDMTCLMLPWYLVGVTEDYKFGDFNFQVRCY